ncbi:hypothetical protein CPC08DRAFT_768903 [Agrocybe pediades]|nr:hypothetical protein CPC08DRAFT_768903 [Agrocybe pediades]
MAKESCNISTTTANGTAIQALNGTLVDRDVLQYYRFENATAALVFTAPYSVNSSSAGPELKNLIDTGLIACYNETIGHATLHGISPPQMNMVTVVANVCYGFTCSKTYQIILAVVLSAIGMIFLFIGWKMCFFWISVDL